MEHYDQIVVGSGVSGLTAALLLGLRGNRVLLLEKAPRPGGSIARFRRRGVPFDVGFHFTGGFDERGGGMLHDMLSVLGLRERIRPIFLPEERYHEIAFPSRGEVHEIPKGLARYREKLKRDFPAERDGIDAYFARFLHVCRQTTSMDITRLSESPSMLPEDFITLQQVLDELIGDRLLQALLSVFCMCHGSRPCEVSFASHCRVAYGLYEPTARVEGGGEALVEAFTGALAGLDVEVRCGATIAEMPGIVGRTASRFVLSDGEEVGADACVLTIHPLEILRALPAEHLTPAFRHRVEDLEPTFGFFAIFGVLNGEPVDDPRAGSIFSIFPDADLNRVLTPDWEGEQPLVLIFGRERANGRPVATVTALEVSFFERVARWRDTRVGRRGESYRAYKQHRAERMLGRLEQYFPAFRTDLELLESASLLTFRDYLNAPLGAAYGIKQKAGQLNLIGRLPIANLYAAGQCAMLPGVLGAMVSSFFVCRLIIGKRDFQALIEGRLCH